MGELIFTFCYGGALVVAGVLVKVVTSRQTSLRRREEEMAVSTKKQGSVI
ncbi:hypothetical protein [Siminovitchia fordii]|uniref:Heme exporter protein D n=1 Tax=Siminovitchia fordii TaxID=254759 RepID=A0ABQ4K6M5_9BACI|nr:hypothetical protein [Siminovitchia fordii]GIN21389.1 hypothetical protein J1TS3_25230 [Siminovitchia fordii]